MHKNSDSTLKISLGAIRYNYNLIKNKLSGVEASAVVKADAYGLGVREVCKSLADEGCRKFFVATLDEALELRKYNKNTEIYVFHGIRNGQEKYFANKDIIPVLNTPEEIIIWDRFSKNNNHNLPAVIHVDTGMNRLGISLEEAAQVTTKSFKIKYIMSHLACADIKSNPKNKEQLRNFNKARKLFPENQYSLANSAGIFLDKCYHFDLARPGCALYGINPSSNINNLKPVVTLSSKIIQIRQVEKGKTVGYGAEFTAKKTTRVAIIPVGYADGYLRYLGNKGICYLNGYKVNIIGRVSMDLLTVNITDVPEKIINKSPEIELINDKITVNEIAKTANTIGYEILTKLGQRFNIIYTE